LSEKVILTALSFVDGQGFGNQEYARSWDEAGLRRPDPRALPAFRWRMLSNRSYKDFGRLDPLCKMSVAAVELLGVRFDQWAPERKEKAAIMLGTSLGSLATDLEFYRTTTQEGGPSPALFSYTLPSTVLAEVAIRHGLKGPNCCFFAGDSSGLLALAEGVELVAEGEADACICIGGDVVTADLAGLFPALGPPASFACAFLLEAETAARVRSAQKLAAVRTVSGTSGESREPAPGCLSDRTPAEGRPAGGLPGSGGIETICRRLRHPAGLRGAAITLPVGLPGSVTLVLEPVA